MATAWRAATVLLATIFGTSAAESGDPSYCVVCTEPDSSYLCRVATPDGNPGDRALRLFCIVKTAKDGGHRSCAVSRAPVAQCAGSVRRYSYNGPAIPAHIRSAVKRRQAETPNLQSPDETAGEDPKRPSTLFGLTSRAVKATGRGVAKTGTVVRDAAGGAGSKVGDLARGAKRRVGKALGCVKRLFRGCGESDEPPAADADQPVQLAPPAQ